MDETVRSLVLWLGGGAVVAIISLAVSTFVTWHWNRKTFKQSVEATERGLSRADKAGATSRLLAAVSEWSEAMGDRSKARKGAIRRLHEWNSKAKQRPAAHPAEDRPPEPEQDADWLEADRRVDAARVQAFEHLSMIKVLCSDATVAAAEKLFDWHVQHNLRQLKGADVPAVEPSERPRLIDDLVLAARADLRLPELESRAERRAKQRARTPES